MASQVDKPSNTVWKEKNAVLSNHSVSPVKSARRLKSPKKTMDTKKTTNDVKIEDVFLNSEYFKYQTGNVSSLSFCSGDNGENQWTINSKFSTRRKSAKMASYPNDMIKSDTAVLAEKETDNSHWSQKLKKGVNLSKDSSENPNKFLEGIFTGKGRFDQDVITLITDQMFLAERELQITRTHLIETISKLNERDLEILQLHEKIQNLQKSKKAELKGGSVNKDGKESLSKTSEDYQRLMKASEKLKKQVKDMEEFLNDYGLVWVGDKETNHKPDFDKIIKSFQRLNAVATQPKIIQTTKGARFELPREISLAFYSNGFLLRDNDFREYSKTSTSIFLQDVEDGYFPSELQSEFPEGVPFEIIDKRNETYSPVKRTVFQGHGNRLGSTFDGKPPPIVRLEPVRHRSYDSHPSFIPDGLDKMPIKKLQKKRSRNVCIQFQEDKASIAAAYINAITSRTHSECCDNDSEETTSDEKLNVKIRFGKEKMASFILNVSENQKMFVFQTALQQKLCDLYHDQCLLSSESNNRATDFELHIYGREPFRLSEHLNEYPRDCGIVNNCVVNISEL